jgi:CarD family transcriptional regulator
MCRGQWEQEKTMRLAVGDKIVHPHHGPGTITSIEQKEFLEGSEVYCVIEIPAQGLILHVPKRRMEEIGVRRAMSKTQIRRMLATLRKTPRLLPDDYKERQEQVWEQLQTGDPIQLAETVRDLTWHDRRSQLTKKDTDYLDRAQKLLAAEMALVSETEIAEANRTLEATLAAAMERASSQN